MNMQSGFGDAGDRMAEQYIETMTNILLPVFEKGDCESQVEIIPVPRDGMRRAAGRITSVRRMSRRGSAAAGSPRMSRRKQGWFFSFLNQFLIPDCRSEK